jgi:hypothetical protein
MDHQARSGIRRVSPRPSTVPRPKGRTFAGSESGCGGCAAIYRGLLLSAQRRQTIGRDLQDQRRTRCAKTSSAIRSLPDDREALRLMLEAEGRLTILDQNRVLRPHPSFRLFATANTVGLGDASGLYHGTQQLNQAQLDRWNIVARLDYLDEEEEVGVVLSKAPWMASEEGGKLVLQMVRTAEQTRTGFEAGDVSTLMSPRTVISWAENYRLFQDLEYAFETTFLNRCDESERSIVAEYYQRAIGRSLDRVKRSPWKRVEQAPQASAGAGARQQNPDAPEPVRHSKRESIRHDRN